MVARNIFELLFSSKEPEKQFILKFPEVIDVVPEQKSSINIRSGYLNHLIFLVLPSPSNYVN